MAIPAATTDHTMAISEQATMRRSQNIPSPRFLDAATSG
jgi:hypothetical protein